MKKFSLQFAILLLTVVALAINVWIAWQRKAALSEQLAQLQKSSAKMEITPDDIALIKEAERDPTAQFQKRLGEILTKQRVEAVELDSEQTKFTVIRGSVPLPHRPWFSNLGTFKIRIPADRNIILTAELKNKSAMPQATSHSTPLPPGEYLLGIECDINRLSQPPGIEVRVFLDGLDEPACVMTYPCDPTAILYLRRFFVSPDASSVVAPGDVTSLGEYGWQFREPRTYFNLEISLEDVGSNDDE